MRFASGFALVAFLVAAASIGAKALPPFTVKANSTETKADAAVEQLIKHLGSDDYRVRGTAGRDLFAKGEKILPNLRAALTTTENPEVHRRLIVMVRKLDYDRLVAPRLVK